MWPLNMLSSLKDRKGRRAARRSQRAGRPRRACVKLGLETLEERRLLSATITVTTTADDPTTPIAGQTTLRDAINQANANPGSTIVFDIPATDPGYGNGVWTIRPTAFLPTITGAGTTIIGTSRNSGNLLETRLDGTKVSTISDGLHVGASNVSISELEIVNWFGGGLLVQGNASNTSILGNSISNNAGQGIFVQSNASNTSIINNEISNNANQGVQIAAGASNTVIQGNAIGSNGKEGILVDAGSIPNSTTIGGPGVGNSINGNSKSGIDILGDAENVVVQGNEVGGNGANGITVGYLDLAPPGNADSSGVTIGGGTGAEGNDIGGNRGNGVEIDGSNNIVQHNTITENKMNGVEVYAGKQNLIQGNSMYGNRSLSIQLDGTANNSIAAPVLTAANYQFDSSGHPSVKIQGNLPLSTGAPNGTYVLEVFANTPAATPQDQIFLGTVKVTANGSVSNPFTGTFLFTGGRMQDPIGIMATVTDPDGNTSKFSEALSVAPPSVITVTTTADQHEYILGQTMYRDALGIAYNNPGSKIVFNIPTSDPGFKNGVWTIRPTEELPEGDLSGATIDGSSQPGGALGKPVIILDGSLVGKPSDHQAYGVYINGSNNTIEGLDIVNWSDDGIEIDDAGIASNNNVIRGNYIGIDPTGTKAEGNGVGIHVDPGARGTIIGGLGPGEGNVISGNLGAGIDAQSSVTVEGNRIGTSANGKNAVGNGGDGILIEQAFGGGDAIGGAVAGASNNIAYNGNDGVKITDTFDPKLYPITANVAVLTNSIYGNSNQGIQLQNGVNNNQAAPDLTTAAFASATTLKISGVLTGAANTTYRVEVFASPPGNNVQGKTFLGAQNVTTNGAATAFTITLNVPAGLGTTALTVTATDPKNNTSPFSNAVQATPPPAAPPPLVPPTLHVPPLLAFLNSLLGGVETVNGNGTETIMDSLFGFPLLVSTFDAQGNLVSVLLFGFNITFLFI